MVIGDLVRVLPPFAESFPGTYPIADVIHSEDGSTAYILVGATGGFDASYLEPA